MIWNAYSVLDTVIAVLRWGLAAWAARESLLLLTAPQPQTADGQQSVAMRGQRLLLVCGVLGALSLAAWPVFYLLLGSYVPRYPGVMCIFGVTQVGQGSVGITRFLPWLVQSVEWLRPLSLLIAGVWGSLHVIDRQRTTPRGSRAVVVAGLCMATLAWLDSSAELAYLAIPKREKKLSAGCCQLQPAIATSAAHGDRPTTPRLSGRSYPWLVGIGLMGGLVPVFLRKRWAQSRPYWLALAMTGVALYWLSWNFWVNQASLILLQPANHACCYCLFSKFATLRAAFVLLFFATAGIGCGAAAQIVFATGELREVAARFGRSLVHAVLLLLIGHFLLASIPLGPLF